MNELEKYQTAKKEMTPVAEDMLLDILPRMNKLTETQAIALLAAIDDRGCHYIREREALSRELEKWRERIRAAEKQLHDLLTNKFKCK